MADSEVACLRARIGQLEAHVTELTTQLSTQKHALLCQICMERPRDTVLLPCAHAMYCGACLRRRLRCPSCKLPTTGKLECKLVDWQD